MSPFALSLLKYSLLFLLYLFVFTAIRSVSLGLSSRRRGTTTQRREPAPKPAQPSRGARPPTRVVVHDGAGGAPRAVALSGDLEIGRADRCAIRLQDHYVSQVHARLFERDGSWHVEDLGSTNGTSLNDQTLTGSAIVHEGDTIRLGQTRLELAR